MPNTNSYFRFSTEIQYLLHSGTLSEDENVKPTATQNENWFSLMETESQFQQADFVYKSLSTHNKLVPFEMITSTATTKTQLNNNDKIFNSDLNSDFIQDFPSLGTALSSIDTFDSHELNKDEKNYSINNDACEKPGQLKVQIKKEISDNIPCLICDNVDFPNLYEYQRHLALSHFKEEISLYYLPDKIETNFPCKVCRRDSNRTIAFANETFLIIHLATFHNCCVEFASKAVIKQLKY